MPFTAEVKKVTDGNNTFYVNASTGNDSNPGTKKYPFKTELKTEAVRDN